MGQGDPSFQKQGFTQADPITLAREKELYELGMKQFNTGNTNSYSANRFGPSSSNTNVTPNLSSYGPTYNPGSNVESGEFSDETGNRNEWMNEKLNRPFYGHGYEDVSGGYSPGGGTQQVDPNLGLTRGGGQVVPMGVTAYQNILGQDSKAAKLARHEMQNKRFEENLALVGSQHGDQWGGRSQVLDAQALGDHQRAQALIDVEEDQRLAQNQLAAAQGLAESDEIYMTQDRFDRMAPYEQLNYMNRLKGTVGMEDHTKKVGRFQQGLGGLVAGSGLLGTLAGAYGDLGLNWFGGEAAED